MPGKQKGHPKAAQNKHSPKEYIPAGWIAKPSRLDRREKRAWKRGRK